MDDLKRKMKEGHAPFCKLSISNDIDCDWSVPDKFNFIAQCPPMDSRVLESVTCQMENEPLQITCTCTGDCRSAGKSG